jgi:hypothetical protein
MSENTEKTAPKLAGDGVKHFKEQIKKSDGPAIDSPSPCVSPVELARRWRCSRSTVGRIEGFLGTDQCSARK